MTILMIWSRKCILTLSLQLPSPANVPNIQIVKRCQSSELTTLFIDSFRNGPFLLLINKSNDKNSEKRFVDLPVLSGGTAKDVFASVATVIDGGRWSGAPG